MTKSFAKLREETNEAGTGFLFTELDTGNVFLDVAETTHVEETRARNRENAHKAYTTALQYRDRLMLSEAQRTVYDTRISAFQDRLRLLGFAV